MNIHLALQVRERIFTQLGIIRQDPLERFVKNFVCQRHRGRDSQLLNPRQPGTLYLAPPWARGKFPSSRHCPVEDYLNAGPLVIAYLISYNGFAAQSARFLKNVSAMRVIFAGENRLALTP